jgi:hypothetical protein
LGCVPPCCRGLAGSGVGTCRAPPWPALARRPSFVFVLLTQAAVMDFRLAFVRVAFGDPGFLACAVWLFLSLFRLVCASVLLLLPPLSSASACVAGPAMFPPCASRFPASFPPPSFVCPLRLFVTD